MISLKRAGRANTTRTQRLLRRASPMRYPLWLCYRQDDRRCWKNAYEEIGYIRDVSIVNESVIPGTSVSVGFSTKKIK